MGLQVRILKEYRAIYPDTTLREISSQTGIQLTRVFRILNGAPMKLHEYERFHKVVHGSETTVMGHSAFRYATEAALRHLCQEALEEITTQLNRKLQWHRLKETNLATTDSESITA